MLNKFKGKKIFAFVFLLIILLPSLTFVYNLTMVGNSNNNSKEEKITIVVEPGTSLKELTAKLSQEGIIKAPQTFYFWGRITGFSTKIQEGSYYLSKDLTVLAAMDALKQSQYIRVTIPEGYTVEDIAKLLANKVNIKEEDFLKAAKSYAPYPYMQEALNNPNVKYAAEGFLFPDTYDFSKNQSPESILKTMVDNFDKKLTPTMRQQAKEENLSIYALVTLASLVEKEAKYAEDRPIIAQVFLKRLAIGMPLQSDATIQYAMPEHKEEFSLADTKYPSPYNTYLHQGLTPGPIGNPGLKSLEAVLHPATSQYLYFVADPEGHNHYSTTNEEHEANIKKIYKD